MLLIRIGGVLTLLAACFLTGCAMSKHYDVYILAGQSNMDGRGRTSELTGDLARFAKPQPDVLINYSNSTMRGQHTSGGWKPLGPGYSVPPGSKSTTQGRFELPSRTFGPEVGFGRALAEASPRSHIAIIKFSEGGTSLHKDWDPANKSGLYPQLLAHVSSSLRHLRERGDTFTVVAMVWHQGESDASLQEGEYEKLLTAFIACVRRDLELRGLPFVIGEVYDNAKRDHVIAGERATADSVVRCYFVPSDGLKTSDNGTHFDAPSQIEMGRRMAHAIIHPKPSRHAE